MMSPLIFNLSCCLNLFVPLMAAFVEFPAQTASPNNAATPVWIFFRDKGAIDENKALLELQRSYNKKAFDRRRLRRSSSAVFDQRDLPLSESYVDQIVASSQRVRVQSRWLNAVSAEITPGQLAAIRSLPFVKSIQPVRRGNPINPIHPQIVEQGPRLLSTEDLYGLAHDQLQTINIPAVHSAGLTGNGIIIGILDTGFRRTHIAFSHPEKPLNVIAEYDFINDDPQTGPESGDDPNQHVHGTIILGTIAAYLPNTYVGAAFDASFILCKTEDITGEYQGEEDYYVAGLEFIEANGGDVATSSLIYLDWYSQDDMDGVTAVTTIAVNTATENGLYCCTAVGNSGHDQNPSTSRLGAPADALQVFSVGSVNIFGVESGFSSDGPTADGRPKPEVLAVGESAISVNPFDDSGFISASGTSLSTPMMAGALACLTQSNPALSVEGMREAFLYTAGDYILNGTHDPNFVRGFGVVDSFAALTASRQAIASIDSFQFVTGSLLTGGIDELQSSDDNYLSARSGFDRALLNRHQMQLEANLSCNLLNPVTLDLLIESHLSSTSGNQQIRLFDFESDTWDLAGQRVLGGADKTHRITGIQAANYVGPNGEIRMRIIHSVNSRTRSFRFDSFLDHLQVEIHK